MKCSSCGITNSRGSKICNHCGSSLNKKFKTCKNGHNYDSTLIDCPYCPSSKVPKELKTSTSKKKTVIDRQEKIKELDEVKEEQTEIVKSDSFTKEDFDLSIFEDEKGDKIVDEIIERLSEIPEEENSSVTETSKIPDEKEITEPEILIPKSSLKSTTAQPVSPKKTVVEKPAKKKIAVEKKVVVEKEIEVEKEILFEKEIAAEKEIVVKDSSSLNRLVGWLVSYDIDPAGTDFKLYGGRTKIGRSNHCKIIVNDSTISEEHVLLLCKDEKIILQDELSANGTFVNGKRIEERVLLKDGDELKLGSVTFIIKII